MKRVNDRESVGSEVDGNEESEILSKEGKEEIVEVNRINMNLK